MPRPPAVLTDHIVDAAALARVAGTLEGSCPLADLPRLRESGVRDGAQLTAKLDFANLDGRAAISGALTGILTVTCQRCLKAMQLHLDETFRVVIAPPEIVEEQGGFEPVVADAHRFDVRWLVEEQTLLALPLVPMHESPDCAAAAATAASATGDVRQRPFESLRDMLRER